MNSSTKRDLQFARIKAVSLAVSNAERAKRFYAETLDLPRDETRPEDLAFRIGDVIVLLKPQEEWYGNPTEELNARITLEVEDAYDAEKALLERGVTVSDPVAVYGRNPIGGFLDSEGNKLWFCSEANKG